MDSIEILDRLVGFPSVVGTDNSDIVDWIKDYLAGFGIASAVLPGPEGDRANIFATVGPRDVPGYVLSGHMDVVPAGEHEWQSDPFVLRADGDRFYGRGTTDMKGFLAAVLAAVPKLSLMPLTRPIHFAFSYDEEAGCRGVPHLIAKLPELCAPPAGAIIGEPSNMKAVRAHKGKAVETAHLLTKGPFEPTFAPPYSSLQIGTVSGGQAVNIIPDLCVAELEARAISGISPTTLLDPVRKAVEALAEDGVDVEWMPMSNYPALSLAANAPLVTLLEELTVQPSLAAVSYGTEAGLFQGAGIDAIICGPGDIGRAHKPNEFITAGELAECQAVVEALATRCIS